MNSLDFIFEPKAVAVIGASHDPTKRGFQAVRALLEAGYAGRVLPVNPKGGELLGLPVARSIAELELTPDLALVCTPAATTPDVIRACGDRGIRGAVVLALGFSETGAAGAELERALRCAAQQAGVRVVGPNTSGILNLPIGLNLIGARGARAGSIGLLVQSGNMALSMLNETATGAHEGISICIGAGNQADLGFADYLQYLDCDARTRAIAMYVEGLGDGRAFYERALQRSKPIVLLKGGRTTAGVTAALSHTGALAGEYAVLRAALAQASIAEVTRSDELFPVAETLATQPPLRGGIVVLSDGGGHATLAADALSELRAPLALLADETKDRLRALLGPNASVANPIDMANAPDAAPGVFGQAMRIVLADAAVGGVLVAGLFGGYSIRFAETLAEQELGAASVMAESARTAHKTLVLHSLYAARDTPALRELRARQVPVVGSLDVGCRCVAAAAQWGSFNPRVLEPPAALVSVDTAHNVLLETEARALLQEHGIRMVPARLCTTQVEAAAAVKECGRAALKVVARSIVHKSDVGGVVLDATDASAFDTLVRLAPDAEGVLVSPMMPPSVAEVLVGARRDAQFGPVLTIGLGGTLVEVQRAVALRLLPVEHTDIEAMIEETPLGTLLRGVRGRPAGQRGALIDLVAKVVDLFYAADQIAELELNPVFVTESDAFGLDARIILRAQS